MVNSRLRNGKKDQNLLGLIRKCYDNELAPLLDRISMDLDRPPQANRGIRGLAMELDHLQV